MNDSFFKLVERLATADVKFVMIGGFAGILYGCTYVTQDIDICCDFSQDNLMKLQSGISDLNPFHRMTVKKKPLSLDRENCKEFKNLYLQTDWGQLDCLSYVEGIGNFDQVFGRSRKIEVEGTIFNALTIDALIDSKKVMKRPHDLLAVEQLERIKKIESES